MKSSNIIHKKEFIKNLKKCYAEKHNIQMSEETLGTILNELLEQIKEYLARGIGINLRGFGKFYTSIRTERRGTHPLTQKEIIIPERRVPLFKAGKELKDKI